MNGNFLPTDPTFAKILYDHVRAYEKRIYKRHGFYSDANKITLDRLEALKRANIVNVPMHETKAQSEIREMLIEIMRFYYE
jgi:hypothetical protein